MEARRCTVVTGASRGIGRAIAERLAARGDVLAICSRSSEAIEGVAQQLRRDHGSDVLASAVDLAVPAAAAAFGAEVLDRFGAPDGLVNNAAVLGPVGPVWTIDIDRWAHALQVGVVGALALTAALAGPMRTAGRGSIVNLSGGGVGGPRPSTNLSAYVTSKVAVVGMTEALAKELAPSGIRVNAIAPGPVSSDFTQEILAAGPGVAGEDLYEDAVKNRAAGSTPEPFLDLLEFVLSDESSWLTGRLLSARWDPPDALRRRRPEIEGSSLFQLRRIDDDLYGDLTRSRA